MKLLTETYTLPSYWAQYLINADKSVYNVSDLLQIEQWLGEHRWLGGALSCSEQEEYRRANDANYLAGNTLDFTFPVSLYRTVQYEGGELYYLNFPADFVYEPLEWQKRGLQYTATGYGSKIPTDKVLYMFGRRYRIYCRTQGNAGTCYIIYKGKQLIVD